MSELTADDKRQLAKMLIPHLMWDLRRARVWTLNASPLTSATANEVMIDQISAVLRAKSTEGQRFCVAIIPMPTALEMDGTRTMEDYGDRERCHASISDGECEWSECPQLRDGEPDKTGRHCPIDTWVDEDR